MAKVSSAKRLIPILYKREGISIRHVDIPYDKLEPELIRLRTIFKEVVRLLQPVRRLRHPIIDYVLFQMENIHSSTGSTEQIVSEIGRLNFIMQDSLTVLKPFTSPFQNILKAKFILQYRQTSRKREVGWNSFKKDREPQEHVEDHEELNDAS